MGNINNGYHWEVTLTSCLGKFFTLLLDSRIYEYLGEANLLGEELTGFRNNYDTYSPCIY